MSTRSRIGYKENNEITSIYCHFDGYPSGVGSVLKSSHNSLEVVKALTSIDYLLVSSPDKDVTVAYGRDRGESGTEARVTTEDVFYGGLSEEYNYLFQDGIWYCNGEVPTDEMIEE